MTEFMQTDEQAILFERAESQRINEELQRKNAEIQQFVYTVSHDLKSPLVTCQGFLGVLREDLRNGRTEDVEDSLFRIERAIGRMTTMIDDLLQLSRIGAIRCELEPIDVQELVTQMLEELSDPLKEANAIVEIRQPLPPVFADRTRLAEVFENLVANALKYGRRDNAVRIEIGGAESDGEVRYYVRDDGPGVPAEHHQRIFGLFQRLSSDQHGSGVGLAAVTRIMEIHGGRVWLESQPPAGATFHFAFPASESPVNRP